MQSAWVRGSHLYNIHRRPLLSAFWKCRVMDQTSFILKTAVLSPPVQKIGARGDGFVRHVDAVQTWNSRTYQLSLSYRFRTGKAFRHRNVEAGSAEEKSRL